MAPAEATGSADRLRGALRRVGANPDPARTAEQVLELLLTEVPSAAAGALLLMHPQTGLFWTGAVIGLPQESCHPFFQVELATAEDSFRRLAATRAPARGLRLRSTGPSPLEAVVERFGFADELRVVFADASLAWGGASLWREDGAFGAADEALLDSVAAEVGGILRASVVAALGSGAPGSGARGMLLVEDGQVVEARIADPVIQRELEGAESSDYRHVDHLVALAATDPVFSTVLRTSAGGWLGAHGLELGPGRVAVILSAATAAELFGARVAGSGLSQREVEVLRLLCQGLTDAEIAAELWLSQHTVHDHVRAIRAKLGVRSRAAVASRIFADAYFEGFVATAAIDHAG